VSALTIAGAHLVTTGLGPFYDGISHFFLSPEDLLPALALGLLAGLRGPAHGRLTLFTLPAAWLAAGLAGLALHAESAVPWASVISFLLLGVLVAADVPLPRWAIGAVAVAVGLLHGALNGAAMARPDAGVAGLAGIVASVFTLVALAAGLVVSLRQPWARIAVRVAGSWIAAVGVLMIGWLVKTGV